MERTRLRNKDMTAAWRHVDYLLVALVLLTAAFGAVLIRSATRADEGASGDVGKHLAFLVVGVVVGAAVSVVDYRRLADWAPVIYGGMVVVLGAVLVVGDVHRNIRAWFDVGPIQIQPAELAKVTTIMAVAAYLGRLHGAMALRHLVVSLAMLTVPMALIFFQPDLGSMLVFVVIGVGLLVVGGLPVRYLAALLLIGMAALVGILTSDALDTYQKDRLTAFASPDSGSPAVYNVRQAQTTIASGGLTGKGLFEGPQTRGGFVPEHQTDFIFTVPGEELGFVGSALLILLLGGIVWRVWRTAQLATDQTGRLICVGVLSMLVFHVFQNIGMNLGIMPVTGIPLPLVSYGGSATIATFVALGLVMNVHMRRFA